MLMVAFRKKKPSRPGSRKPPQLLVAKLVPDGIRSFYQSVLVTKKPLVLFFTITLMMTHQNSFAIECIHYGAFSDV